MSNSSGGGLGIVGLIGMWMLIVFLGALMGWDSCTCGFGPEIRKSVGSVIVK
jgi:hypothetical protein